MKQIIFLGTNGWYDTDTGRTVSILIDTAKCYFILDAGSGMYKLDKHILEQKPIYLLLSHYHFDHIVGFHFLFRFGFKQGITIIGQEGIKDDLDKVICAPYTVGFKDYAYPVKVHDFEEIKSNLPYEVQMFKLRHSKECVGYRFNIDNKVIAYCADTGYCDNAILLADRADILIAECAFKEVIDKDAAPHLDPLLAATIAKKAGAKKLFLIHFDASLFTSINERYEAQNKARSIFSETIATLDDMVIKI
jgi:ribonuclease BN (tRNA processing enzyme)